MNKFVNDESNEADCEVTDMLKNVLIVVDDIEKSIEFYRDLFGLQVILQNEGNVICRISVYGERRWMKFLHHSITGWNCILRNLI